MDLLFAKLDQASDNPRPRWKRSAEQSVEIRLRGVPEADRADIITPRLTKLDAQLAEVFERRNYIEADAALSDFDDALMLDARAYYERARKAAGDGVDDFLKLLTAHRWNALEIDTMRRLLVGE